MVNRAKLQAILHQRRMKSNPSERPLSEVAIESHLLNNLLGLWAKKEGKGVPFWYAYEQDYRAI